MVGVILIAIFIGLLIAAATSSDVVCPRVIMGYECRYNGRCDHSPEAIDEALRAKELLNKETTND